ncbi:GlxA family transcriptional regulator [Mesorhizobium sp. M0213]|uniref:GlxA family transcriptional regulator n=1 Tax=Mesorhizobium sp. M0213 TaxID=2956917 RepID=UPI00333711B1
MILRALRPQLGRRGDTAPRLSVGFLLLKRFTLSAFANFIDVLRLAADEGDRSRPIRCQWRVISADLSAVYSSCGIAIRPHELIGNLNRFDYIVVVGGLIDDQMQWIDEQLDGYLRQAAALGIPLVGLCTGSFVLHRAGLMDGYRCCVSWFHDSDFLRRFDGLKPVSNQIFVVDRDRLTCSGGASTAHLAAFLVERHLGKAPAAKSLRIMMFDEAAAAESPQPAISLDVPVRDQIVKKALLLMQQHLDVPLSIEQIAAHMQINKRRVERRFRLALKMSPLGAYTQIRLEHARHLLAETGKSVAVIAAESGYCDSSHLGRLFQRRWGVTPREFRSGRRALMK